MPEEQVEIVKEEATPSAIDDTTEVSAVTTEQEEVKAPEPGSIEYTKAVEERIGKVVGGRIKAEAQRDLYKDRLAQLEADNKAKPAEVKPEVAFGEAEPVEASFEDYNAYIKGLASWQFRKEQSAYEANRAHQAAVSKANKMERDFKTRANESGLATDHPDFYEKMRLVNLVPDVLEAVLTSDKGPELALHLANNPEIMRDLNTQSPLVAAKKLGMIEAKLSGKVTKKKISDAPNPLKTVETDTSVVTEDSPKDINDWMKQRNKRELAKITNKVNVGRL